MKQTKTEAKNDTQKAKTSLIKIIIIIAIIISINTLGPLIHIKIETAKYNEQQEIIKLEEQKIELEAEKTAVFKKNGFTKKYYTLENDLDKIKEKIASKESTISFRYTFLPIIVTAVLVAILLFGFVLSIIISDVKRFSHSFPKSSHHMNIHKQVADQQKVVFDLLNRRIQQEELKNTKLKPLKCPSCKANVEHDATKCEYCGTSLIRVKK